MDRGVEGGGGEGASVIRQKESRPDGDPVGRKRYAEGVAFAGWMSSHSAVGRGFGAGSAWRSIGGGVPFVAVGRV